MTQAQAHQFVSKWKRIMIPWFARTETEALRDMERSCTGMLMLGLVNFAVCLPKVDQSFIAKFCVVFAVAMLAFAFPMIRRCREARRALEQS
jgi:hypothetical protein